MGGMQSEAREEALLWAPHVRLGLGLLPEEMQRLEITEAAPGHSAKSLQICHRLLVWE